MTALLSYSYQIGLRRNRFCADRMRHLASRYETPGLAQRIETLEIQPDCTAVSRLTARFEFSNGGLKSTHHRSYFKLRQYQAGMSPLTA